MIKGCRLLVLLRVCFLLFSLGIVAVLGFAGLRWLGFCLVLACDFLLYPYRDKRVAFWRLLVVLVVFWLFLAS